MSTNDADKRGSTNTPKPRRRPAVGDLSKIFDNISPEEYQRRIKLDMAAEAARNPLKVPLEWPVDIH